MIFYIALAFLFIIGYKLIPLVWYRFNFFRLHKKYSKASKPLKVLPFNYGLGQQLDFMDPTKIFDAYLRLAEQGYQNDGILINNLALCPGFLISNPKYIKDVCIGNYQKYTKGWIYTYFKKLLGNGLVISDGNLWKTNRNMMNPIFGPANIAELLHLMQEKTRTKVAEWSEKPETRKNVQVSYEMSMLTFQIIMDVVFGIDQEAHVYKEIGHLWEPILSDFFVHFLVRALTSERIASLFPWGRRVDQRLAKMTKIVQQIIDRRREQEQTIAGKDLLGQLLRARDEDGKPMSDTQLMDEIITFLFAGHETTSSLVSWLMFIFCSYPDVQKRVIEEVDKVDDLNYTSLQDMKYMHQVINETLRLYPPVPEVDKTNTEDTYIGDYFIPKGSMVGINILALHRDPSVWEKANEFIPERWADDKQNDHRYSYIPFSTGHRNCIGRLFALSEAPLIVTLILKSFSVQFAEGFDQSKLEIDGTSIIKPKNLKIDLIPRAK